MGYPFRYDYLRLSSEDKPTEAADESTLYEVNTGKFYVFYKGTWYDQDFD